LWKIREAVGACGQVAIFTARYPVTTAFVHRGKAAHVEAGAKRPALAGQYYRPHAFFSGQPIAGGDKRIEHRGVERVHLLRAHQADIGDAVHDRDLDATLHASSPPPFLVVAALQNGAVRI
jgi:hypothetical protein